MKDIRDTRFYQMHMEMMRKEDPEGAFEIESLLDELDPKDVAIASGMCAIAWICRVVRQ